MGTTSGTNSIFTGTSQFSKDFQNVISRATAIASLPIEQLTADKTDLSNQADALSGIDSKFKALQSAVQKIADSLTGSSFDAQVSDDTKLKVSLSTGASEGNYTVDVVDAGVYATSMTTSAWAGGKDARTYQLSMGGVNLGLSVPDNDPASVVNAINSQYGDQVHATLVNVGSGSAADYRVSLQAVKLGDSKPGLLVGPATPLRLQTQQAAGSSTLATSQTAQTWNSDPALSFRLSVGGAMYDIVSSDNSAQGISDAINQQYGSKVTASVVDVGSEGAPDYRIHLAAAQPGDARPDILASDGVTDPVGLQAQDVAGSDTRASSQSSFTWPASAGPALSYQLAVGGVNYSVTVASNSADDVVAAINQQYGSKVTAAKVDIGSDGAHDYRIALTAVNAGDLKPDLIVGARDVQTQQATGTLADYVVNNSGKHVTSDTRSATIATGITVNLAAKDNGTPVNITVTRSTSAVSDALAAFADAYNAAVDEIDKQHGQTSGPLAGQSLVGELSRVLSGLATYNPAGEGIDNLAALGLEVDKTGHMSFDQFQLMAADFTNSTGVTSFLGSTTAGFLKLAIDSLNAVEDSVTGLLPEAQSAVKDQITRMTNTIADNQARVDRMTEAMQEQMSAADALIASMEQQYSFVSGMFSAMQTADQQYK